MRSLRRGFGKAEFIRDRLMPAHKIRKDPS